MKQSLNTTGMPFFPAFRPIRVISAKNLLSKVLGIIPLAEELGQLVVSGIKTGTCSALWEWEAEGNPIPQPGLITIVLDGHGNPLCIIETTEVVVCRFNVVDDEFANAEGEGDLSLEYWRKAHINFFSRVLPKIGKEFSEDMPLVCERFRVIYK